MWLIKSKSWSWCDRDGDLWSWCVLVLCDRCDLLSILIFLKLRFWSQYLELAGHAQLLDNHYGSKSNFWIVYNWFVSVCFEYVFLITYSYDIKAWLYVISLMGTYNFILIPKLPLRNFFSNVRNYVVSLPWAHIILAHVIILTSHHTTKIFR